ncbi:tRNA pseudouridine(55) synthase TruB [Antarcticibacterium flavum]|uniref:tRNA pseudouridine synthase B n=1 Tax=Antarcticibacterium flavum TaxID=2058175 RepID=A0A5B7X465_9FLAO|nr:MULTISPECIES: tRNA pseudouridine(55) synthase TruB [Antarcticibacterium]MCM4159514.1 tRNA pseudouridine(55) synthase TruB [Antarcticibacterium sp. W02-3]QCY69855.1 tRNA pseudouridine(55) synthase TruB [Antarcticibacterium flavum]
MRDTKYTAEDFMEGQVLLFDKPLGWTSFQVVNKVRWLIRKSCKIKKIKVGHAGTLDPLASGLLIICTGKFTKKIDEYQGQEKEYTGTFTMGATTPSYDLETEIDKTFPIDHISQYDIDVATAEFIGEIEQIPPVFSALKKDGKRLYEYARSGEEVEVKARKVEITDFEITANRMPELDFRVVCSKGTYIRSLANDFGLALGTGAHLSALRRTKIGTFHVDDAMDIPTFENFLP